MSTFGISELSIARRRWPKIGGVVVSRKVPRGGLPQVNYFNSLAKGGTVNLPTRSLCFLARVSHPRAIRLGPIDKKVPRLIALMTHGGKGAYAMARALSIEDEPEELHCRSERRLACRIFDKGAGLAPASSFAD
jgi:hypothetical protein